MKNYVVFKEEDFIKRVRLCIEIYSKELGIKIDKDIPIIITDRMSRGLGCFRYRNFKPHDLRFSSRLLDGRFILEDVEDVISHEIMHYLVFLLGHKNEGHGKIFKKYCKMFGCNGDSTGSLRRSDLYTEIKKEHVFRYEIRCSKCGYIIGYDRMCGAVSNSSAYKHTEADCGGNFERIK